VKPFVKWAGGKTFLLPCIEKLLPSSINTYYEPMVGGGALLFRLLEMKRIEKAVISDTVQPLMNTYLQLKKNPYAVLDVLKSLSTRHMNLLRKTGYAASLYYHVRETVQSGNPATQAAKFIYLNKTCYNGLFRVNKSGEFNAPYGSYQNPTLCNEPLILEVSKALKNVRIFCADFEESVQDAKKGDLVYFDPPYLPIKPTSFVSYTKASFTVADHERLERTMHFLTKKGVKVILSASSSPLTRKIFRKYTRIEVQSPRRINSKGQERSLVTEYLIVP
jgi:DNA adenine methylase